MRKKKPFKGRHVFGELREGTVTNPPTYVVYSYDHTMPIYVYDYEACQWFGLEGGGLINHKTTLNHLRKFKPYSVAHWLSYNHLMNTALMGYTNATAHAVEDRLLTN
jgi:hypothetical protein